MVLVKALAESPVMDLRHKKFVADHMTARYALAPRITRYDVRP